MSTAVVTGAAGGIGAAICDLLAARGFRILAVDVDADSLATLQHRLPDAVTPFPCDLTDPGAITKIPDALPDGCDLLVHTAGVVVMTPFNDVTFDEVGWELDVNLVAPMLLTRALFPALQAARGHVIAIASLAGLLPVAENPGYTASKFGLRGFLLALAAQSTHTGVRVSIVNPGAVDTAMLRKEVAAGASLLEFLGTPLEPADVARRTVALLDNHRLETNIPAHDGWLVKTAMLVPALSIRAMPHLERFGRRNRDLYMKKHHISRDEGS